MVWVWKVVSCFIRGWSFSVCLSLCLLPDTSLYFSVCVISTFMTVLWHSYIYPDPHSFPSDASSVSAYVLWYYIYLCNFFLLSLAVLCAKNLAKKDFFRKYSDCDLFHMHISGIIKSPCDIGATVKTECHWCCSFAVLRDNCWPVVALEYNNDPDCHPTIRGLFKAAKLLRVCPVLFLVRIC